MAERLTLVGGCGRLGRELHRLLRGESPDPIVLVDPTPPDFEIGPADLWMAPDHPGLPAALEGTRACVNLAALLFPREQGFERQLVEMLDAAMASIHAVVPALKATLRVWIQVSSISVYEPSETGAPLTEASPTRPVSPYGLAKLASELYLDTYFRRRGVVVQSLRFGDLYGGPAEPAQDTRLLPSLLRAAASGASFRRFGDGDARRELLHVRDAARAIALALKEPRPGAWNVAGDAKVSLNAMLRHLEAALSRPIPLEEVPGRNVPDHVLDGSAFERVYGFRPAVPLAEGLAAAVAALRPDAAG